MIEHNIILKLLYFFYLIKLSVINISSYLISLSHSPMITSFFIQKSQLKKFYYNNNYLRIKRTNFKY